MSEPRPYNPLTPSEIDWLRRYVERNPNRQLGARFGRILATIDVRDEEIAKLRAELELVRTSHRGMT